MQGPRHDRIILEYVFVRFYYTVLSLLLFSVESLAVMLARSSSPRTLQIFEMFVPFNPHFCILIFTVTVYIKKAIFAIGIGQATQMRNGPNERKTGPHWAICRNLARDADRGWLMAFTDGSWQATPAPQRAEGPNGPDASHLSPRRNHTPRHEETPPGRMHLTCVSHSTTNRE